MQQSTYHNARTHNSVPSITHNQEIAEIAVWIQPGVVNVLYTPIVGIITEELDCVIVAA